MMTPELSVLISILVCIAGALLTLVFSRNKTVAGWLSFIVTSITAVLIFSAVATVLTTGPSLHPAEFWSIPMFGFALRIHVDGLSAIFLMLAAFIAVPSSFYSIIYMRSYGEYGAARYYPQFLLFLAAMYGLLSTTDMMWFFFIFWQLMTLPGYALIRYENRKPENIRAANKYLFMMEIACAATMVGAELLASTGAKVGSVALKYDFDSVSANLPALLNAHSGITMLAFALFLVGFGIKMGMWPFGQVWLPDAHPAAPSPVSAMLSGVMIKTGVYGLMRYFLWLVPPAAWTLFPLAEWGMVIAFLGTVTLFTGTMQALRQEQSKRLLAFHSIGQIGYILLGLGVCMALLPSGDHRLVTLAAIGLFGALYHVINHGIFKGLLFLNAGSIRYATGTQDLNKLGGLMKFMPLTAVTALVASFSISGVPLFNGFVSKWSIYVAAVQGSGASGSGYLALCAIIAILTSVLTLASFIKFFGVSFASRPSALVTTRAAQRGRLEVPWMMQLPQVLLAVACVGLGIMPAVVFNYLQRVLDASRQGFGAALADAAPMTGGPLAGIQALQGVALFAPLAIAMLLGTMFLITRAISKLGGAKRRVAAPWLCGYVREADCHRYTAHNFYGEIKRWFRWLGGTPHPDPGRQGKVKGPLS
jgi:formate hydrogenlyase subunit 3/multisubunit Na+/H+ antiporter MnhD subunit